MTEPVLVTPDLDKKMRVKTDASDFAMVLWDTGTLTIFIFLFFYFSDFILIFFFFWMIKKACDIAVT